VKVAARKEIIMKVIPAYVHGIFDYIGGLILLFAPEIFRFSDVGGAAVIVARVIGVIVLLQALMTRYEVGLLKVMPMKVHLMNDYIASIFLAVSPWLFGFAQQAGHVWLPHLVIGILVFLLTLMTETEPRTYRADEHLHRPA
jgi:hypothetical protein